MLDKIIHHSKIVDSTNYSDRQQRIYDFLRANPTGVLSSVTPDGDPHGAVIYYRLTKDFEVEFLTKAETRKYDNLTHNNHATLTVFEPRSQTTAQVTGIATEITNGYGVNVVAAAILGTSLKASDAGLPPISKLEAGPYVAFRITPLRIRMAVYARPDSGDDSQIFESIESFELEEQTV